MIKMDIKKALQKALDFEKKGYDIYFSISEKTQNEIVKRTFVYLAEQETNHIAEIKEFISENYDLDLKGDHFNDTKEFFKMTVKDFQRKTELSDDDIKAHETALEMEKSAYSFYEEQYNETDKKELKKFFNFLMEQENAHYELIQKTLSFIKDPENYYAELEQWSFEG